MHAVADFIVGIISALGYWGIFVGMFIESASIPLPSEIIMGFAGYLVFIGKMSLWKAALVGALGNISGSTFMYVFGKTGGRIAVRRFGKFFHFSEEKLLKAEKMFKKWGSFAVFIAQLLPGVRTFISLPAGILRIPFGHFIIYTFIGALIWCYVLAFAAFKLGEHWQLISKYTKEIEVFLAILLLTAVIYWFFRRRKAKKYGKS